MEDIFRFLLVRPADAVEEKKVAVTLEKRTPFQADLANALSADLPLAMSKEVVNSFTETNERYIGSFDKLALYAEMSKLRERIEDDGIDNLEDLQNTIQTVFHQSADSVVKSSEFEQDENNLSDSIIAIKLATKEQGKPVAKLVQVLQVMNLIRRAAASDDALNEAGNIIRSLNASIRFPDRYTLSQFIKPKTNGRPSRVVKAEKARMLKEAKANASAIRQTIRELMDIRTSELKLVITEVAGEDENTPERRSPVVITNREGSRRSFLGFLSGFFGGDRSSGPSPERISVAKRYTKSNLMLSSATVSGLREVSKTVLTNAGISATDTDYEMIVTKLKTHLTEAHKKVDELRPKYISKMIGLSGTLPIYLAIGDYDEMIISPTDIDDLIFALPFSDIKSIGIGELLIVKQQLMRYQGGDVAHIENVLQSESKSREHRRARKTEQFYLTETEVATEEERDLESTERFEIQIEADETIKEQSKLETGLNITASYGSVLEVEASLDYSYEKSKERSKKVASDFSKEVVNKSVSKLSEKIRERQTLRLIEEYEEKITHGFNNEEGEDHIIGVYQWVDKVYEAQVYNYGRREMYEFMIPEPGAFLSEALKHDAAEEVGLEKPEDFDLEPDELDEDNYGYYAEKYEVVGIDPPPPEFITLSKALVSQEGGEGSSSASGIYSMAEDLKIEDGYEAIETHVIAHKENISGAYGHITVSIGKQSHLFAVMLTDDGSHEYYYNWTTALNDEVDYIPLAVITRYALSYSVVIEIKCKRTGGILDDWRHKTYDAIMQAFLNKRAAYEEKLAALSIQEGVTITGQNPARNRKLEKDEIKKNCISILTKQHFDMFDSIEIGPTGLPQTNLTEAETEGRYIRFFEQAFEWENITYILYPYYWGRKENWCDKIKFEDADPQFVDFITAGAARVVVPARDEFRSAIRHFLTTGEIWMGGELPDIDSSLYLPIVEELKEQLGAPGEERRVDEPWHVTIPTSLIRLRPDGSLPQWTKNEKGEWVSVESTEP
jgi:hypothetical protein